MPAPRKYDPRPGGEDVPGAPSGASFPGESAAIASRRQVGALIDAHSETMRGWIERVEVDADVRPGTTTDEHAQADCRSMRGTPPCSPR